MLKQVTATPLHEMTGDLGRGFWWLVPGARPPCSHAVMPLAAPAWPTVVTVELWWPPEVAGLRHVRTFGMWATDPFDAYQIACCLWSTKATGAGAEAAYLYGPDRRVAYRISAAAWACSQIPSETIARVVATVTDRDCADPLPDAPRTSAMREERINGMLTWTGDRSEITTLLREHAEARNASADYFTAAALNQAANEIESCTRSEFTTMAAYVVNDLAAGAGEPAGRPRAGEEVVLARTAGIQDSKMVAR